MRPRERTETFTCFGSTCALRVGGEDQWAALAAVASARASLLVWHRRFSRFIAGSELARLNEDPRHEVPVTPLMGRLLRAVRDAGERTGGLVDGTLLGEIECSGYSEDLPAGIGLAQVLAAAPRRSPAGASASANWRLLEVDERHGTVRRPPGIRIDGGGLAKGLFADVIASTLRLHERFVVDCAGDLAVGGLGGIPRPVQVASPFDGSALHTWRQAGSGGGAGSAPTEPRATTCSTPRREGPRSPVSFRRAQLRRARWRRRYARRRRSSRAPRAPPDGSQTEACSWARTEGSSSFRRPMGASAPPRI
jgi:thiamine biosynthesis lipoprotein ApbE